MADLNPLKFAVAIQDEATGQLGKIEEEFNKLKDQTINVKVEGLQDLQDLLSALQHKQVENLGKDVATGVHDAAKGLQEEAQKAVRASLGQLAQDLVAVKTAIQHDNFSAFTTRIENCAEAVNTLDAAFKQFHVTIGSDAGMKNFMTGLGEVIRNVRTTMGQLNGFGQEKYTPESIYVRNVQKMQDALYRIQEARLKVGVAIKNGEDVGFNTNGMKIYLQLLDSYEKKLQAIKSNPLMMHENGWQREAFGTTFKHLLSNAGDFQRQVDGFVQKQNTLEANQRRFNVALEESEKLLKRLDGASTKGFSLGVDTSKTERALNDIQQFIDKLLMFDSKNLGNNHAVNELIAEYTRLKSSLSGVAREQEKLNATTEKSNQQAVDNATKQAKKDNEQWAESMRRAGVEATKLEIQIRKLQDAENRGKLAHVDTTNLSARIAELQSYVTILRSIESGSKLHGHTSDFINSVPVQNSIRLANEEASAVRQATAEKEKAARASQQLSAEEQRLAQALNQTTESAKGQSQVLADLKSMATQYLGVWGGQQFLHNIIEIGGQLEMQRLSIGAILQNTAQANELFDKIKHLATQSPFGVVQLDQMTKQLTAYGFKYNELYDMTKRLADISAATGTDVSRLALALGHVRSEAALSGYTLRQFSMANVPLLEKLSEKLGKTTKEIRDMVKKKEVGYDDVVGVLKDLTNEGGMFYNMQEVISESVKAKFKNVKDAMDIMYGEMAEGAPGDALKEVANVLMELTQNWKDVATVMGTVAALWGVNRAATLIYTKVLGTANATTLSSIAAFRAKEAEQLRSASLYRTLTAAEKSQIATSKLLTTQERIRMALHIPLTANQRLRIQYARQQHVMDLALALSEKKLTAEDIARQVALGKITKAEAAQIIALADLTNAQKLAALEAVNNTRILGFWGKAGYSAALGIRALGTALKSLVFNPAMLAMAGITAVMELWQRNKQELERAGEIADSIRERSNSAMQATKAVMQSSKMEFEDSNGNKISPSQLDFQSIAKTTVKVGLKFDEEEAKQVIDEMADYIRQYSATPNEMLNNAFFDGDKMRSKEEQFRLLAAAVGEVAKAQYGLHDIGDVFENAINATNGGWFNDDIVENINDYEKAVKNYNRTFAEMYREHGRGVDKIVKAVEKSNSAFATAVSGMNTYGEKFKFLIENMKDFSGAYNTARKSVQYSDNDLYKFLYDSQYGNFDEKADKNWAKSNMDDDLETFFTHIEAELNNKGQKIGELTQAQQQDLLLGFTDFLGKKVTTKETTDYPKEKFAERFQLNLDVDDEKFQVKVDEVTKILNGLVEGDWKVDLTFVEHIDDAIEEARKRYKLAKEFFEKTEQIRLKFGIDLKMGQLMDDATKQSILSKIENKDVRAQVAKVIDGLNQASTAFNKDTEASNNLGFSLEDPNKKKSGHKAYKDEFAKRWDERISIMKEAHDWYEKWEKKVGNDAAVNEVLSKYGDIFEEWRKDPKDPLEFDVKNIADFAKYIEKIRDDALARYRAQTKDKASMEKYNNGKEAERVYKRTVNVLNDIKYDKFIKAAEQFKSIIDQTIDDLNTRWEIYNTVREATGNESLAMDVAGITGSERHARNSADAMRDELLRQLRSAGGEKATKIGLDVHIDEESLREKLEVVVDGVDDIDTYRTKIDGLLKSYQEWQKLQRQVQKDDVSNFAQLIGSVVSYDAQLRKIDDKLEKQKAANQVLVGTTDKETGVKITQSMADRANTIAEVNASTEKLKISSDYINLMNRSLGLTRKEVVSSAKVIEDNLNARLRAGVITASDYADEMDRLRGIVRQFDENSFFGMNGALTSFMSGGVNGMQSYVNARISNLQTKEEQDGLYDEERQELDKLRGLQSQLANATSDLNSFIVALKIVTGVLDGFQKSTQRLSEMFDALGNQGASALWGDIADGIGAVSSVFAPLSSFLSQAKNGDIGGMISSGLSLPVEMITGPITGFAKLHDKNNQRHIEALQRNVSALEANTSVVRQLRDRTLGYDTGDLRRALAASYASGGDAASAAMQSFYGGGERVSGYAQELRNLKDSRQDYLDMYNEEADKKKSSEEALLQYKQKIAELDEQIQYFSEDLAKELWDIDIKGWGDQLSDALSSAFENGESVAKAYKETVTNILQQVMNKMMRMSILEPMFQDLHDTLFGNDAKKITGIFDVDDLEGSMSKVTSFLADFFGQGGRGEKAITASTEFMAAYERGMQNAGLTVKKDSANTLSSSIQGTSEETSSLLAGYVNALRQDVAANRILFTQFVTQLWPEYVSAFASHVTAVAKIDANVQLLMEMMRDGSGAFFSELQALRTRIDNVVTGIDRFHIS